jgi:poly-gamma-glutamate synthesis protein (capsule biosynthesis protein)
MVIDRRRFLAGVTAALVDARIAHGAAPMTTLFLCGDVMTGRGIDQIMATPSNPHLYESYVRSAMRYVEIAERATGPIARTVSASYIWGDALAELDRVRPSARIVNLETSVTTSDDAWPGKGIHYRMHPANADCLKAARLDCCSLANNHVLDWGYRGLAETIRTLRAVGIRTAGAGADQDEALAPAIIELAGGRRVIVFALAMDSAGVPHEWAATKERAGVAYLPDLAPSTAQAIAARAQAVKRSGDIVVVSIHWGGNWGYEVPRAQRAFARLLVDGGVDVVHGHSSHHPKAIEIHRDRPILFGCGDFLNDYEGIGGYERYRGELGLMYFPVFGASGALEQFTLVPTRVRHLRVNRAHGEDVAWLATMMTREGAAFGTRVVREPDETLTVHWR